MNTKKHLDPDLEIAYRKAALEEFGPASETAWERVRKLLNLKSH